MIMEIDEIKMDLDEVRALVDEFSKLPKIVQMPTYLELCRYPSSRFEEICSRLISFYIRPTNDHGFADLLLSSLLLTIDPQNQLNYNWNNLKVSNEVGTDNYKRLDIFIESENFVIGIENKITANLYNPLDEYRALITNNKQKKPYCVVLSLRKIIDKNERQWLQQNGFINITYKDFFNQVKTRIGSYLTNSNDRYLTFLKDFINTIENMENSFVLNPPLDDFFAENGERLEVLNSLFEKYKNGILAQQCQKIAEIKEKMVELTNSPNWSIWEGYDLICQWKPENHLIGIEATFESSGKNPLGLFSIYITGWGNSGDYFKTKVVDNDLLKEYQENYVPPMRNGRPCIVFSSFKSEEGIIDSLEKAYNILNTIFSNG